MTHWNLITITYSFIFSILSFFFGKNIFLFIYLNVEIPHLTFSVKLLYDLSFKDKTVLFGNTPVSKICYTSTQNVIAGRS